MWMHSNEPLRPRRGVLQPDAGRDPLPRARRPAVQARLRR